MNLILLQQGDAIGDDHFKISDTRATHIRQILKSQSGDIIKVGLINGPQGQAVIEKITTDEILLHCQWSKEPTHPEIIIDLICALPRPQTLKKVLQSCAAMDIRRIHLIRANRTEKTYFDATIMTKENYMPFLLEGLSQGKKTHLPKVFVHNRFKPFFEDTLPALEKSEPQKCIKLLPDLDSPKFLTDLNIANTKRILLAIGPEGGWVPIEIDLMQSMGFEMFNLGNWVLRVENALVAAISQIALTCRQ